MAPKPLLGMLEKFIEQVASAVAAQVFERIGRAGGRASTPAAASAQGRICPSPGCRKAGAGPRNRWFCKEHARSVPVKEQKRLLADAREESQGSARLARGGGKARTLDMKCRVEDCKNKSRGPRFGYICDEHQKSLSAKEQQGARDKYKASQSKKKAA